MQRHLQRYVTGWVWVAGAVGALVAATALSGCPGTLDPNLQKLASEMGGSNGSGSGGNGNGSGGNGSGGSSSSGGSNGSGGSSSSGGSTGSGGSSSSGGSTGSGGSSSANCTGGNDGATLITTQCAVAGCHDSADANSAGAGLDLTVNSGIGSRLVGVTSAGDSAAGSVCGGNTEPYLVSGSSPATGLLIQKMLSSPKCSMAESPPCCGDSMPYPGVIFLTTQQQNCIIQWATTLTSP